MGKRLRRGGGYRKTVSFQTATIIYDATYWFCERFLDPRSRTVDQMVQAARSGRQNIAEGSRASRSSSQTELRLLNAARFSQEELLLDYEDYLRHRHLPQWEPQDPEAMAVREVPHKFKRDQAHRADQADRADQSDQSDQPAQPDQPDQPDQSDLTDLSDQERWDLYAPWLDHNDPAVRANALICLINQVNYLLDQQITAVEQQFVEEGGYSEQLAAARLAERDRRKASPQDPTDPTDCIPLCPRCGGTMVLRTARAGKNAGAQFWGCTKYPDCRGTLEL